MMTRTMAPMATMGLALLAGCAAGTITNDTGPADSGNTRDRALDSAAADEGFDSAPDIFMIDTGNDNGEGPCGTLGDPCCNGTCNTGGACVSGSCEVCGSTQQACCAGNMCGGGLACSGGRCVPCGGNLEPCCAGSMCSCSLICHPN